MNTAGQSQRDLGIIQGCGLGHRAHISAEVSNSPEHNQELYLRVPTTGSREQGEEPKEVVATSAPQPQMSHSKDPGPFEEWTAAVEWIGLTIAFFGSCCVWGCIPHVRGDNCAKRTAAKVLGVLWQLGVGALCFVLITGGASDAVTGLAGVVLLIVCFHIGILLGLPCCGSCIQETRQIPAADVRTGLTVTIPPDVAPGAVLRATGPDGKTVQFTVPGGAVPGQQCRVPFNAQQPPRSAALVGKAGQHQAL